MPTDLMGLSPEEIGGVASRRTASEAGQRQQLGMILNLLGHKGRSEALEAQTALSKAKLDKLMNPEMTDIEIDKKTYSVPKESFVKSLGYKVQIEGALKAGRMSQAEHDAKMRPVTIHMPGPDGKLQPVQTTAGHLEAMSKSIKDITSAQAQAMREQRRTAGLEALGETKLRDVKDVDIRTLITGAPEAQAAIFSMPLKGAEGPTPETLRKLKIDQGKTAQQLLTRLTPEDKEAAVSDAEISSYNTRSKELNYPSMMLHYKKTTDWFDTALDTDKTVEVKLPIDPVTGKRRTPADVEAEAVVQGVTIEKLLKGIYEAQLRGDK